MSKGNLFLGQARGRLGDVVFYHSNGVQVARARNRSPRNPRAVSQMVQRIVMNTVSKAYSTMQAICDHAFQGQATGTACQSRFSKLNVAALRDKLAAVIADPTEEKALGSIAYSFSIKDTYAAQYNDYIISEGTLPPVDVVMTLDSPDYEVCVQFPSAIAKAPANVTYQDVVDALGLQAGDQLTFIQLGHRYGVPDTWDDVDVFTFARVILEPDDGDMTKKFFGDSPAPASANTKNEGSFSVFQGITGGENVTSGISFLLSGLDGSAADRMPVAGSAVIVSRFSNGKWLRSTAQLVRTFDSGEYMLNSATFSDAYASYLSGDSSGLYLNGSPT